MTCVTKVKPQTKTLIAKALSKAFSNGVNISAAEDAIILLDALGVTLPRQDKKRVSLHSTAKHLGIEVNRHWNGDKRENIRAIKAALPKCDKNCTCAVEHYRSELERDLKAVAKKNPKVIELEVTRCASNKAYLVRALVEQPDADPEWVEWKQCGKSASAKRIKKLGRKKPLRGSHLTSSYFLDLEREANQLLAQQDPWGAFSIQAIRPHDSPKGRSDFMAAHKQSERFPLQLMFLNTPEATTELKALRSPTFSPQSIIRLVNSRVLQQRRRLSLREDLVPSGNFLYSVVGKDKKCLSLTDMKTKKTHSIYPSNDIQPGTPRIQQLSEFAYDNDSEYVVYAYSLRYQYAKGANIPLIKFGHTKIDWVNNEERDYLKKILTQRGSYLDQLNRDITCIQLLGYTAFSNVHAAKNLERLIKHQTETFDFHRFAPEEFNGRVRAGSELRSLKAKDIVLSLIGVNASNDSERSTIKTA